MAFDFYDANSDQVISNFDLFKTMQFYSHQPELFTDFIQKDILTILKLFAFQKTKVVGKNFRRSISKDQEFLIKK